MSLNHVPPCRDEEVASLRSALATARESLAEAVELIRRAERHAPPETQGEILYRDFLARHDSKGLAGEGQ